MAQEPHKDLVPAWGQGTTLPGIRVGNFGNILNYRATAKAEPENAIRHFAPEKENEIIFLGGIMILFLYSMLSEGGPPTPYNNRSAGTQAGAGAGSSTGFIIAPGLVGRLWVWPWREKDVSEERWSAEEGVVSGWPW